MSASGVFYYNGAILQSYPTLCMRIGPALLWDRRILGRGRPIGSSKVMVEAQPRARAALRRRVTRSAG